MFFDSLETRTYASGEMADIFRRDGIGCGETFECNSCTDEFRIRK